MFGGTLFFLPFRLLHFFDRVFEAGKRINVTLYSYIRRRCTTRNEFRNGSARGGVNLSFFFKYFFSPAALAEPFDLPHRPPRAHSSSALARRHAAQEEEEAAAGEVFFFFFFFFEAGRSLPPPPPPLPRERRRRRFSLAPAPPSLLPPPSPPLLRARKNTAIAPHAADRACAARARPERKSRDQPVSRGNAVGSSKRRRQRTGQAEELQGEGRAETAGPREAWATAIAAP